MSWPHEPDLAKCVKAWPPGRVVKWAVLVPVLQDKGEGSWGREGAPGQQQQKQRCRAAAAAARVLTTWRRPRAAAP